MRLLRSSGSGVVNSRNPSIFARKEGGREGFHRLGPGEVACGAHSEAIHAERRHADSVSTLLRTCGKFVGEANIGKNAWEMCREA